MITETQKPPLVSVIMPVRNEGAAIQRSLDSVLAQDYPKEHLEVLVADGMSDDGTRDLLSGYAERDARIRIIDNPARIMVTGFNAGLDVSRGEVVIMLGGHSEIAPDYVGNCVRYLQQDLADCVGGPIETIANSAMGSAIALAMSTPFGIGGVAFRVGTETEGYVDTVAFGAYTRKIITQGGRLDEELVRNQDDEYNYRLRKLGARILLSPAIRSRYYSRSTLGALWSQYFQYGLWKVRVMQKHPRQMRPRQFAPPLFVAACLLSLGLSLFSPLGLWLCALVFGSYLLANLCCSFLAVRKGSWKLLPLLPVIFATLHFSYGSGFLLGLARFWNRWSL
jgi:glycosyltransferase involved in cell wall biosynthesis